MVEQPIEIPQLSRAQRRQLERQQRNAQVRTNPDEIPVDIQMVLAELGLTKVRLIKLVGMLQEAQHRYDQLEDAHDALQAAYDALIPKTPTGEPIDISVVIDEAPAEGES